MAGAVCAGCSVVTVGCMVTTAVCGASVTVVCGAYVVVGGMYAIGRLVGVDVGVVAGGTYTTSGLRGVGVGETLLPRGVKPEYCISPTDVGWLAGAGEVFQMYMMTSTTKKSAAITIAIVIL